jgi:hypothetical protein
MPRRIDPIREETAMNATTFPAARTPRALAALAGALVAAVLLSGCGASSPGTFSTADSDIEPRPIPVAKLDAPDAVPSTLTPGTQYAVTYRQHLAKWQVSQGLGRAKVWRAEDPSCATGALPNGFWIVTRGADGSPELLAPSHTELPEGFPERVALKTCGDGDLHAVHAPQAVIDLLASNAGLVYVDD